MRLLGAVAVVVVLAGTSACASTGDPYAGLDAEGLWMTGIEAFEAEEWTDAIGALGELVARNPAHPRAAEARMHIAQAYVERGELLTAASEFERVIDLSPNDPIAAQASLGVCRAYADLAPHPQRDQRYTEQGRDACGTTVLAYPGTDAAEEAAEIRSDLIDRLAESTYGVARFYRQRSLYDPAIVYYEEVAQQYQETEWAPRALLEMFRVYRDRGWMPEATEAAERLLARHPESDPASRLRQEEGVPQELIDGGSAADGP